MKYVILFGPPGCGKGTQSEILLNRLKETGHKVVKMSFPMYDTPTGKIAGGPYLGKDYICDGWFSEGAVNVNPKVSSLYYAADRKYNVGKIEELLNSEQ